MVNRSSIEIGDSTGKNCLYHTYLRTLVVIAAPLKSFIAVVTVESSMLESRKLTIFIISSIHTYHVNVGTHYQS